MTTDTPPPTLRDRQRVQVLTDIRVAAYRLFAERGFDAVTTEEIASAAGISQRTLFRHVSGKDDIVLGPVRGGGAAIIAHLAARPAEEEADQALVAAILARTTEFGETALDDWRRVVVATDLLDRVSQVTAEDRERVVALVAERMGANPATDQRPALLTHLAFAAGDFGFQQWARQPAGRGPSLAELVAEALAAVTGPQWGRQAAVPTRRRRRT